MPEFPADVLSAFAISPQGCLIQPIASGLINATWRVDAGPRTYILQRLNTHVFKRPETVAANIRAAAAYLRQAFPDYLFPAPLPAVDGADLYHATDGHCYRLLPFVEDARTLETVATPEQAYAAARAFAGLTRRLAGLDASTLDETLPGFHDLAARFERFAASIEPAEPRRRAEAQELIDKLLALRPLVDRYRALLLAPGVRRRIMHFDTKISNVLFDASGQRARCVIDLDTLMPGYFFDDVGDMVRTYVSPANEEETDLGKVEVRPAFLHAIEAGYLDELGDELSATERANFRFAGELLTYMQALRFLTDYLQGDVYYGSRYPGHNLSRAWNQAVLLEKLMNGVR
jgi:Ser/Thr protein kinase RdoA (MazF antagonist)